MCFFIYWLKITIEQTIMKILKIYLFLMALLCQNLTSSGQSLLTDSTNIRFFSPTNELDQSWKLSGFDDSNWSRVQGEHILGYGDFFFDIGDPLFVKTEETGSLYVRTFFNVESKDSLKELNFICDYDDGFVAYINGVEFARINMGKSGSKTTLNQTAERSHDLEFVRNDMYPVSGFYVDQEFIDSNVVNGENVLAIEVHNDSIDGSDLGFFGVLLDITDVPFRIFEFSHRYKKIIPLDSTHLPIVVIETDEYGIPYRKDSGKWVEVPATLGIINGDGYNKLSDSYEHFGNIDIQYRGESSSSFPKLSYDIELKDDEGKDTSISLLGMPREADWIIQGPFADKSQIRNALFYELARKTGHWTPNVEFCELVINGHYVGLYNLIEKIKRDSNRINIGKLRPEEISGTDLTGGYILKYDKPGTLQIVYPKEKNLQPEQEEYILNFIDDYEKVLYSSSGLDPYEGYSKYIDDSSLIDYIIISELGKNCDSYLFSTYFYKNKDDRDPRLKFGPIWDFDLSMGNSIWQDGFQTFDWQFEYYQNKRFHIKRLFEDPELVNHFNERYTELRQGFLHKDSLFNRIDELVVELREPLERNYEIWPLIDEGLFFPAYFVYSYNEEIDYIKTWLTNRLEWMDANIGEIYYPVTDYPGLEVDQFGSDDFSAEVYPNPVVNEMIIDVNIKESASLDVELIDIQGKTVSVIESTVVDPGSYKIYWSRTNQKLKNGLYIVSIKLDGEVYSHLKVIFD